MAKSFYYIKLHHDIIDDMKTGKLSDGAFRVFVLALCMAGELGAGGTLPDASTMAWRMRIDKDTLRSHLSELAQAGLVTLTGGEDTWQVINFAKRQAPTPVDERVKQWRKRKREQQRGDVQKDIDMSGYDLVK